MKLNVSAADVDNVDGLLGEFTAERFLGQFHFVDQHGNAGRSGVGRGETVQKATELKHIVEARVRTETHDPLLSVEVTGNVIAVTLSR